MTESAEPTEVTAESGVLEVSAKKTGFEGEITVTYDFGKDLDEMVSKFGAAVVHTNARANMKVTLQGVIRRQIEAGKGQEDIQALVDSWLPGVQMERTVDPLAVARKALANMSDEDKQIFIDKLLAGSN